MAATTIKRYPLWVIGAVVALCAALALFLLTPGIAQAQSLDNEDAALASRAQGSTNDTQITQVKEDDAGVAAMSPQQQPQAMQQQPAYYEPAEVRVVRPGDTLWSISEQRLQPNPTPEQIMNEVERIYELNRSQIGDNPNLIFAGQQFLLPALYRETAPAAPVPSGGGPAPSTTTPATTAVPPSAATEQVRGSAVAPEELPSTTVVPAQQQQQQAAAPQQQPQAAQEEEQNAVAPEPNTSLGNEQGLSSSDQPTTNPNKEEEEQSQSATEANEQPRIVPPWPAAQQTPSEQQPTSVADSIAQSFKEFYENSVAERRVLGLGVIALTLGAAVLMVWRLPMKRNVGDPMGWRIPRGGYYYEDSPSSVTLEGPKAVATGAPDATDKQSPSGSSDSDRSSVSSTEQGQADRASTSRRRSEAGYLGPEENNNGEQDSANGEQNSFSPPPPPPPLPFPPPPRNPSRRAPPRAPY